MIRVRPELRVTITRYSEEDDEDIHDELIMEESSLGSRNNCCEDNAANCSAGEQHSGAVGHLKGRSSRTPSPSGSHTLLSSLFTSAPMCTAAAATAAAAGTSSPPTSSLQRLTVNNTPTLLTLDWTEGSSNKFLRIQQQSHHHHHHHHHQHHHLLPTTPDDNSPLSPSRNYQERLILPLGTKEIEFTVPQTLSPLTPTFGRKGLNSGDSSPGSLSGSRSETEQSTSRANTPSPIFFRGSGTDISGGMCLGGLNPELYKCGPEAEEEEGAEYPENHYGRVWYALEYETTSERLLVTLIKARNLSGRYSYYASCNTSSPTSSTSSSTSFSMSSSSASVSCNPLVRVSLFPDERRTLQSKGKKNTRHPQFDETFGFQISKAGLAERSLKLCFYDVDESKKFTMLGYIIQPLKDIDWSFGKQMFKEDLLRDTGELSPNIGETLVSLCYNGNISRLTVNIIETKGIKSRESASGLYAKISLHQHTKILKTKKTSTVALVGCRSSFNESFNFKLPAELLDTASVSIQLMYAQPGYNKDQPAGRIVLGSFMFARGKGLDHWTEMLSKQKESIQYWHAVSE